MTGSCFHAARTFDVMIEQNIVAMPHLTGLEINFFTQEPAGD